MPYGIATNTAASTVTSAVNLESVGNMVDQADGGGRRAEGVRNGLFTSADISPGPVYTFHRTLR